MPPVYTEHRADGWPLCPCCGEDELYSNFTWDGSDPKPPMQAWIDHGLRCYYCDWSSTGEQRMRRPMPARMAMHVPPPVLPPPTRFVLRYGVVYCDVCGLATPYCKGHAPVAPPAQDGDASDLTRRIREARTAHGGR